MVWPSFTQRIAPRNRLAALVADYAGTQPTVGHAGVTRTGASLPPGFDHIDVATTLPAGSFETAAAAVQNLTMHRKAGLLTSGMRPVALGDTVVLGVPLGPLALVVPCRIVWTATTGEERGFGYATLPNHPEAGEEGFLVTRGPGAAVTLTVRAFSRPAGLARAGSPLGRRAARILIGRYLTAMRALTD